MRIFIASISILTSGCMSIAMRTGEEAGLGQFYSGTTADVRYFAESTQEQKKPKGDPEAFSIAGLSLIDLPFSLVVDTLCIPYDFMNIGRDSKHVWYGTSMYRVVKTDRHGAIHGKCSFQFHIQDSKQEDMTIWGYTTYKHGIVHGTAEVWSNASANPGIRIKGEYIDGKPWSGSLLIHASDPNSLDVGPVITYNQGLQVDILNIGVKLKEPNKPDAGHGK